MSVGDTLCKEPVIHFANAGVSPEHEVLGLFSSDTQVYPCDLQMMHLHNLPLGKVIAIETCLETLQDLINEAPRIEARLLGEHLIHLLSKIVNSYAGVSSVKVVANGESIALIPVFD